MVRKQGFTLQIRVRILNSMKECSRKAALIHMAQLLWLCPPARQFRPHLALGNDHQNSGSFRLANQTVIF